MYVQFEKQKVCTGKYLSEALIFASTNPQYDNTLQEYSRSFEDVSSNTVIYFRGIPKEFRGNMTVLLEISDKDPLYSHCYQVKH